MRVFRALISLALIGVPAAACGGKPVGGKVPKVSAAKAGGVAAAAAALTTIADPAAAKHRQEHRGGERPTKAQTVDESVPEGVLARSENDEDAESVPCKKPVAAPAEGESESRVQLIPTVDNRKPQPNERCKDEEADKTDEDGTKDDDPPSL